MMRLLKSLWPSARVAAAALCAIGVLHIAATLAAPHLAPAQAFDRLSRGMPPHSMTVLPPVTPATQKLPFMSPDATYAICPFDTQKGPVSVKTSLPSPGWTLALYSPEGENFYVAVAQPGRPSDVSLLLVASDDRFTGLTPQSKGQSPRDTAQLKVPADRGFVLLRAPDQGQAYRQQNLAALKSARCTQQKP